MVYMLCSVLLELNANKCSFIQVCGNYFKTSSVLFFKRHAKARTKYHLRVMILLYFDAGTRWHIHAAVAKNCSCVLNFPLLFSYCRGQLICDGGITTLCIPWPLSHCQLLAGERVTRNAMTSEHGSAVLEDRQPNAQMPLWVAAACITLCRVQLTRLQFSFNMLRL